MLIREAGIFINKVPIIYANYPKAYEDELDLIFTNKLMSRLLLFAECLMAPIAYFENNEYTLIFKKGNLLDYYGRIQEITAFLVVDKNKKLEKYLDKRFNPLLEELLKEFISHFYGCKITEVAKFEPFKKMINKIFY